MREKYLHQINFRTSLTRFPYQQVIREPDENLFVYTLKAIYINVLKINYFVQYFNDHKLNRTLFIRHLKIQAP